MRFAGQDVAAVAADLARDRRGRRAPRRGDLRRDALRHRPREGHGGRRAPRLRGRARSPDADGAAAAKGNIVGPQSPARRSKRGDVEKGFAEADVTIEAHATRFRSTPTRPLETHGVIAKWEGDELTIYASTQGIFTVRDGVAEALGIDRKNVTVHHRAHGRRFRQQAGPFGHRQPVRGRGLQAREAGRARRSS